MIVWKGIYGPNSPFAVEEGKTVFKKSQQIQGKKGK
jgi:hypothetical protein